MSPVPHKCPECQAACNCGADCSETCTHCLQDVLGDEQGYVDPPSSSVPGQSEDDSESFTLK
jgi:hypothetical protein